jgi:hypothetical protein
MESLWGRILARNSKEVRLYAQLSRVRRKTKQMKSFRGAQPVLRFGKRNVTTASYHSRPTDTSNNAGREAPPGLQEDAYED